MILLYVSNKELDEVREFVEDYPDRISYRNPRYFDGVEQVDKVLIYGRHQTVDYHYRKAGIPVEFIDYKHDVIPSEEDKEPAMTWTRDELNAYATLKGIEEPEALRTKQDVIDAITSHSK
ncbi:hypothetical protein [Gracilimonas sediminicola]|uniref:Uncharacterized protein n=1 Tax=Gracilimonas sediminicola TaxID=2952158 RepID=A0A9X2L0L7_9BACT|nr:hypothetical protein [Gracilimonas sediminicola]MCP9289995.1 hypothetical protein [Gracilimonas sediminicola]